MEGFVKVCVRDKDGFKYVFVSYLNDSMSKVDIYFCRSFEVSLGLSNLEFMGGTISKYIFLENTLGKVEMVDTIVK